MYWYLQVGSPTQDFDAFLDLLLGWSFNNLELLIWKVSGYSFAYLQIAKMCNLASSTTKHLNFRLLHIFFVLSPSFLKKSQLIILLKIKIQKNTIDLINWHFFQKLWINKNKWFNSLQLRYFVVELAQLNIFAICSQADERPETFHINNFKLLKDHPGNQYRKR